MEEQNWGNLGYYDYNARFYNPYVYVASNPLKFIDPTGMSYSEHIDGYGNMIAHFDDGDQSVYVHESGTTEAQASEQRTSLNNTGGNGVKIGELGKNIDLSQIMSNKLAESSEAAKQVNGLGEFASMVQTGSTWD